jgi:hypothetical protein
MNFLSLLKTIAFFNCFFVCNAFFDEILLKTTVRHFHSNILTNFWIILPPLSVFPRKGGRNLKMGKKYYYNAQCRQEKRSQTTTGLTSA